jgi:hypothetical protein
MTNASGPQMVEIRPWGAPDRDAARTATALAAYFEIERVRAFRRRIFPIVGVLSLVLIALAGRLLSTTDVMGGLLIAAAVVVYVSAFEWRADNQLRRILARRSSA